MDPAARAQEEAHKHTRVVNPSEGKWFANIHSTMAVETLNALHRCKQYQHRDDFAVLIGMSGTLIERIDQVLADRLVDADPLLPDYRTVLHVNIDAIRRLVNIPGEQARLPYDVLNLIIARAVQTHAVLVLDHVELLDPNQTMHPGGIVEESLLTPLSDPSGALILALYWEATQGMAASDGILKLPNARWRIPIAPYSPDRARSTLFDHFVPHWQKTFPCVFEQNAFDTVFALEPGVWLGNRRQTLPYLTVFLGRDVLATIQAGSSQIQHLAKRAHARLDTITRDSSTSPEVISYFAPVMSDVAADLTGLIGHPEVEERNGSKVITRGHLAAQLLGEDDHDFRYPLVRPREKLPYRHILTRTDSAKTDSAPHGVPGARSKEKYKDDSGG